jgi:hypothetical protein
MIGVAMRNNEHLQQPSADSSQLKDVHADVYSTRPFLTRQADLDIDFVRALRPLLITLLLSHCLRKPDGGSYTEDELWNWSLRDRLQALLAIVIETQGQSLSLRVNCPQPDCGELVEIELDLTDFKQTGQPGTFSFKPVPNAELQLRIPNGLDQLEWLKKFYTQADNRFAQMATTLTTRLNGEVPPVDWQIPEAWLDLVSTELEQRDTLTDLEINTVCPACHRDLQVNLDIEEKLLALLALEQERMLEQIHQLASVYHWTEGEIVSLSRQRRLYYLKRINGR